MSGSASNNAHKRSVEILVDHRHDIGLHEYIANMLARNHPMIFVRYADRYLTAKRKLQEKSDG